MVVERRLDVRFPVTGQLPGSFYSEGDPLSAVGVDVSKSGIGITSDSKIPLNDEVIFKTHDEKVYTFQVVWCREIEGHFTQTNIFRYGLKLLHPDTNFVEELSNYNTLAIGDR